MAKRRDLAILGALGLAAAALYFMNSASAATADVGTEGFGMSGGDWQVNDYPKYAAQISSVEAAQGIPPNLLGRLLYQESAFRPEVISGAVRSSVGAVGIAQFMPATAAELGIDPTNPTQSIAAAGRYLRQLYDQTGSWQLALAAYNWGIGNVLRKGFSEAPTETRNYVAQITADVPVA